MIDAETGLVFAVAVLMGLNQLVVRLPGFATRLAALFWILQLANLTMASWMLTFGLPNFREGALRAVPWLIGLLFIFHLVQNNNRWGAARRAAADEADAERDAERARVAEALKRGEGRARDEGEA